MRQNQGYNDEEKQSWWSKKSRVMGWGAVKVHSGEKNMSENNYERVGIPFYFSRATPIPSIGNSYAPFVDLYIILERVHDSTQNPPA